MNSATALVEVGGDRLVAKWVPADAREQLLSGARLARRLAEAG